MPPQTWRSSRSLGTRLLKPCYSYTTIAPSRAPIQRYCNSFSPKCGFGWNPESTCRFRDEQTKSNTAIRAGGGWGEGMQPESPCMSLFCRVSASRTLIPSQPNSKWYADLVPNTEFVISKCYRKYGVLLQSNVKYLVAPASSDKVWPTGKRLRRHRKCGTRSSQGTPNLQPAGLSGFHFTLRSLLGACAKLNGIFWSGRADSNCRPHGPEPCALPNCATPRAYLWRRRRMGSSKQHVKRQSNIPSPCTILRVLNVTTQLAHQLRNQLEKVTNQ